MDQRELLIDQLNGTREWTLKLLADLKGADWGFQPGRGLAHPLYLCGHLAVSQDTLVHVRCLGKAILPESFSSHFPIGRPVLSAVEHDFPPIDAILLTMADVQVQTCDAIRGMSASLLDEPAYAADGKSPHPHYLDKRGAISHCGRHEAFHAGQVAMIRRLLGRTFLR